MNDVLGTGRTFVSQLSSWRADDEIYDSTVVTEITDKKPEVEISWSKGKDKVYLRFRLADFERALSEFK